MNTNNALIDGRFLFARENVSPRSLRAALSVLPLLARRAVTPLSILASDRIFQQTSHEVTERRKGSRLRTGAAGITVSGAEVATLSVTGTGGAIPPR